MKQFSIQDGIYSYHVIIKLLVIDVIAKQKKKEIVA